MASSRNPALPRKSMSMSPRRSNPSLAVLFCATIFVPGCDRDPIGTTGAKPATSQATAVLPVISTRATADDNDPATILYRGLLYQNLEQVQNILSRYPELANAEVQGNRPLALASESLPMVQLLVEKGAQVNARAAEDLSVLYWAVRNDSVEIVKYLILKGADPKAREKGEEVEGRTLLWAAKSREMAEFLVSRGVDPHARDKNGDTALHQACRNSYRDVVEFLLNSGIHVETKGRWDMPPLHSAASTLTGDPRPIVNLLLQRGAAINSRGFHGHTVLHEVAYFNRPEMADILLANGADPNLKDGEGKTPLDLANLAGREERARVINLLIKHGAPGKLMKDE
jgi:ankyrin repeat protein